MKINLMKLKKVEANGYRMQNVRGSSILIPKERMFSKNPIVGKKFHVAQGEAHEI